MPRLSATFGARVTRKIRRRPRVGPSSVSANGTQADPRGHSATCRRRDDRSGEAARRVHEWPTLAIHITDCYDEANAGPDDNVRETSL